MKRMSPVVIVGIVLTLVCFFLYVFEPPFISAVSLYAYDVFVKKFHSESKSGRVALVDVDEASLSAYGQWPWSRDLVAKLTASILEDGASVVAFDIVFAEADGKSPQVITDTMSERYGLDVAIEGIPEELSDFDGLFADVLKSEQSRTILGCFMHPSEEPVEDLPESCDPNYKGYVFPRRLKGAAGLVNSFLVQAKKMTISIPRLSKAAGNNAFYNTLPDSDNVVRRNPLLMAYGPNRIYPALALEAVRMDQGISKIFVEYGSQGIERLRLKDITIPTDYSGSLVVNFRKLVHSDTGGGFSSFPTHSAADVLQGRVAVGSFSNKIVFIGTSAPGLRDLRATPLTPEFAGVEVHATIVDNILAGDMLSQPAWIIGVDTFAIVLIGLFLTVLIHNGKAVLSFIMTIAVLGAVIALSFRLFDKMNFVFVPARLVISTIIIYPVLTMIKYWEEERQRKQVRNMFGTMVSQDVLRYLEHNPSSFSLSGHKTEATMFFSDVAGFTTISEALEPAKLSDLLNKYLSPMTQIIMDRRGYVDKYEGDAIMAEWGVPFSMEDHAVQACLAALEQQEKLSELRAELKNEFGHELRVRMGINSGSVTAGNMGSDKRFQYTVMGDAVNLAARLEPTNKDYGTEITLGEATFEKAKHAIEARLLDKIQVVGKGKPVCVYELLGRRGRTAPNRLAIREHYEAALRLHWERNWDEALALIDRALAIIPDDGASLHLRSRVRAYKITPPADGWAGEYVRATKD